MPANCYLTDLEKGKILAYSETGHSKSAISRLIGRSRTVISNFLLKGDKYGLKKPTKGNTKIDKKTKRRIIRHVKSTKSSSNDVKGDLKLNVTARTVRNVLSKTNFMHFSKIQTKPVLTKAHRCKRLTYATECLKKGNFWSSVCFVDEKRFNLDGPDGFHSFWHDLRDNPNYLSRRQFGGGSIMIWMAISMKGKVAMEFVDKTLDSIGYQSLLSRRLLPNAKALCGKKWKLLQDNAPPHSSKSSATFLELNKIDAITFPPKSPDLNPIENIFGQMARDIYKNGRQYLNLGELKSAITNCYANLKALQCEIVIKSIPDRLCSVLTKMGGSTKY